MAYIRTVRTASGARAVQIVYSSRKGSRQIEHIGSAHDDVELELLRTVARQRLAVLTPNVVDVARDLRVEWELLKEPARTNGGLSCLTLTLG